MDPETLDKALAASEADDRQAVKDVRKLVIDICRQNGGGHGGSAIGMAPMAVALWRHVMRYNPHNPGWFDRDRFVLSNGHAAMLLYTMLHVAGYEHVTMDELKLYGSAKVVDKATGTWESTVCDAHPEIEVPGVEVTTGPLGQGVANAVGLALASKQLAGTFNKPSFDVVKSHIYCVTGDGCLQEGVAGEAMALAGHLGLDTLTLLYDNNSVTCDGPIDWIVSENTNEKMRAMGWHVIDVLDGDGDGAVARIAKAVAGARLVTGKPTFINIRTTIGFGTSTAGTFKSHHGTYTDADAAMQATEGVAGTHALSPGTQNYFGQMMAGRGVELEQAYSDLLSRYAEAHPSKAAAFALRRSGKMTFAGDEEASAVQHLLRTMQTPATPGATRTFNGAVFNKLMEIVPGMVTGGADLWNSNQMGDQSSRIFHGLTQPSGRVVRFGIREHAMAALSNGLAAFAPGTFLPVTATFFMFYLYAAPAVRMGALSNLRVVHVATHDSIGEGQNGPTHQPVEVDSLFRAMPNLRYVRPADPEEVLGAWAMALGVEEAGNDDAEHPEPAIISLARDPPLFPLTGTNRAKVARGGYVLRESSQGSDSAEVTLVSCGSELQFAAEAAKMLDASGIATRVVSMPCIKRFERQPQAYQDEVLSASSHIVSVEAYVSSMWARLCTASVAMDSFGYSGAGAENFARFGIDADGIVKKVSAHVNAAREGKATRRWTLLK